MFEGESPVTNRFARVGAFDGDGPSSLAIVMTVRALSLFCGKSDWPFPTSEGGLGEVVAPAG